MNYGIHSPILSILPGREVDQLFQTADVTRAIGHPKNADAIKDTSKRQGLPEPLGI